MYALKLHHQIKVKVNGVYQGSLPLPRTTPIKRVRVLQSKTSLNKLENSKFAVRDRQGKAFKWVAYGNIHHVEVVRNSQNEKVSSVFLTMMEAAKRVNELVHHSGLLRFTNSLLGDVGMPK